MDIKVDGSDKLPTTLCQTCTTKIEDMQNFYNHCHDAQKMLAVQYGVQISDEGTLEDHAIMMASTPSTMANLIVKEDEEDVMQHTSSTATLSADKLLETAIKDTCILSGEDSDESEMTDGLTDDEQSAIEDKVVCLL